MKTACFTGHRSMSESERIALEKELGSTLERLIGEGVTVFRAGGALGFDTLAAIAVINARKKYPQIQLELILPCIDQARGWSQRDLRLYEAIKERADSVRYVSQGYFRGVMLMRNRALVDNSDVCIAFLRSGASGGTAYTVSYAQRKGVPVIHLCKS